MSLTDFGQIRPAMWTGTTARACKGNAIALWLMAYIPTAPGHHSSGLFPLDPDWVAFKHGFDTEDIRRALGLLEDDGFIAFDPETGEVFVAGLTAIRHPEGFKAGDNLRKHFGRHLGAIRSRRLVDLWQARYGATHGPTPSQGSASNPHPPSQGSWPKTAPLDKGTAENGGPLPRDRDRDRDRNKIRTDVGEDPGVSAPAREADRPSVRPPVPVEPVQVRPEPQRPTPRPVQPSKHAGPIALAVWSKGSIEDRVRWLHAPPAGDPEPALAAVRTALTAAVERAWSCYRQACEDGFGGREVDPEAYDAIARAVLWLGDARGLTPADAADRVERLTRWAQAVPALTGRDPKAWRWPLVLFGRAVDTVANGRRVGVDARLVEHWNACLDWEAAQAPPKPAEDIAVELPYEEERAMAQQVFDDEGYAEWLRMNAHRAPQTGQGGARGAAVPPDKHPDRDAPYKGSQWPSVTCELSDPRAGGAA